MVYPHHLPRRLWLERHAVLYAACVFEAALSWRV